MDCICNSYWIQIESTPGEFYDPKNKLPKNSAGLKSRVMYSGCPVHNGNTNRVKLSAMDKSHATIIAEHYGVSRVTKEEVEAEFANLKRKKEKGTLDDQQQSLAVKLGLFDRE